VLAWGLVAAYSESSVLGLRYLIANLFLVPSTLVLAMYWMPRTPMARKAFLRPPDDHDLAGSVADPGVDQLVGQSGRALTPLRPSGMVDFDGRRLDGVAEQGLIAAGSPVLAVAIRSGRVIVRALIDPEPKAAAEV
jgi:hypothetical protein